MQHTTHLSATTISNRRRVLTGRIISWVVALFLAWDAVIKLMVLDPVVQAFNELGYSTSLARPIGLVELVCVIFYLIPKTSIFGAILLTGYLGGATATKVRMEDPWLLFSVAFGILLWLGVFLQNEKLRRLFFSKK
jgi:hypothetical protein